MTIGLLLITHNNIGTELLETAVAMLGHCPLQAEAMDIRPDCDPDLQRQRAKAIINELDQGDGVLIMTDMYGSTPSNIACGMIDGNRVTVVAGANLPMLVRVMNYPQLDLMTLTEKAESGGHLGIRIC
jgi:PTS system ascorbate-specific IIA component